MRISDWSSDVCSSDLLLYEIAKTADVFLTNYLPSARQKLKIDIEHIRAANPDIIYVRGSAFGDKGPERDKGGFDSTAYWARGGSAVLVTPKALDGQIGRASCRESVCR